MGEVTHYRAALALKTSGPERAALAMILTTPALTTPALIFPALATLARRRLD
ncbi:hypothetical protein IT774_08340 [Salinimonas marina]|uniref:Uncharacterized protein n=1 Tax=Salinimonas marina TaxID=2785918 RepID=A0A7S9HBP6_9ALTE|nr:hypothetical protein [Salinimonas marina]QPG04295.1 hypothetical protein IT774_08340 [Salinimonas marina]